MLFRSADMAHAFHPSHQDKHDEANRPVIGKGMVIKENADDRYASSGFSSTIFKTICDALEVPHQDYIARQDMSCGSTVGPSVAANLGCPTVDVGCAMWGMHSSAETMGANDLKYAIRAFRGVLNGEWS